MIKINTLPLESATRKKLDIILNNLGWVTNEFDKCCNVFTERVKTNEQKEKIKLLYPNVRFPDYVLYKSNTDIPLAIIETKRIGLDIEKALEQAEEYAKCLNVKVVFAYDGFILSSRWVSNKEPLKINGEPIYDLLSEKHLLNFIENSGNIITSNKKTKTREDLITIFKETNDLLRNEGLREGVERFSEFSNILFLKLIDEIEDDRELRGEKRRFDKKYSWSAFSKKNAEDMLDYINDTILKRLVDKYNHSGDVFSPSLKIKKGSTLKTIVNKLDELTLLDVDSDVKGDAFEYFLKNSITIGNDLGEYYTPRHIVKLMVELIQPKFGDKIYDPCCGTGGFLIEAFRFIKRNSNLTGDNIKYLEEETIYGGELTETSKIAKMNMILAGDGHTHIKQQDSLANPAYEQYDVVLSNFPFNQKTDYSHLYGMKTVKADAVFFMHIINALKNGGRAAVIVPDSVLFSIRDNDILKLRKKIIEECNILSIIQLDNYTFAPYTLQPTSIVIFNKEKKHNNIWFYELKNDGFSKNQKRTIIRENDIPNLRTWWNDKKNNNNAFEVEIDKIQNEKYKLFLNFYKEYENIKYPKELSYICYDYILGMTPTRKNKSFYGDKYLWVKISDMKEKIILDTEEKLSQLGYDKLGENKYFNKGSLLFSFKLTIGKVSIAGEDLFTNEAICKLCLKDKYNNELVKDYLYYILPNINYKPFAQRAAKGYTLNKDILPTVVFPFSDSEYELEDIVNKYKLIENQILKLENDIANIKKEHSNLINSIIFEKNK